MRKVYEYLQNPWYENINEGNERRSFLSLIDDFVNQKQYIRITLLDWQENALKEIQGELNSGGSLAKDGASSVRRTCSFTCTVSGEEYNVEDGRMDFAINKKIFVEIGIKNYTDYYKQYPILWFPQGVFFISQFSISSSSSSAVSISLNLKDKMCGLNGEVGGTFPATVVFDQVDTQTPSGEYISEKILIYNIIQELVHHFGGEDLNNIVIEDVPLRIKRVMKWTGSDPIYMIPQNSEESVINSQYGWYDVVLNPKDENGNIPEGTIQITNGRDAGYVYDDFVYTGELTANAGENVCTVLDKIKQYLGNFEYFYDEFGVFHFREIKNYLNTTQGKIVLDDMSKNDYLVDVTTGESVANFSDDKNIISINANPQYGNIKNDYIVEGLRKSTVSDASYPIRYHLAIDNKPKYLNEYYNLLLYKETNTGVVQAAFPLTIKKDGKDGSFEDLPIPGNFNMIYRTIESNQDKFWYWENDVYKEVEIVKYIPNYSEDVEIDPYVVKDWRTELYLEGMLAKNNGTDGTIFFKNVDSDIPDNKEFPWVENIKFYQRADRIDVDYYFEELEAFWPQIYDLENQRFYGEHPSEIQKAVIEGKINNANSKLKNIQKKIDDENKSWEIFQTTYGKVVIEDGEIKYLSSGRIPETKEEKKINTPGDAEWHKYQNQLEEQEKLEAQAILEIQSMIENKTTAENNITSANEKILEIQEMLKELEDKGSKDTEIYKALEKQLQNTKDTTTTLMKELSILKENIDTLPDTTLDLALLQNHFRPDHEEYHRLETLLVEHEKTWDNRKKNHDDLITELKEKLHQAEIEKTDLDLLLNAEPDDKTLLAASLCDGNYFLDFIDPSVSGLGEFSVQNIGRRSDVIIDNEINCLFEPEVPDIVFINIEDENASDLAAECREKGQPYTQVHKEIFLGFSTGGYKNAAFNKIQFELYTHTNYQKTLSITALPAFYLDPNLRITINDKSIQTYGDFMITNISFSMGPGGTMSVTCSECIEYL